MMIWVKVNRTKMGKKGMRERRFRESKKRKTEKVLYYMS